MKPRACDIPEGRPGGLRVRSSVCVRPGGRRRLGLADDGRQAPAGLALGQVVRLGAPGRGRQPAPSRSSQAEAPSRRFKRGPSADRHLTAHTGSPPRVVSTSRKAVVSGLTSSISASRVSAPSDVQDQRRTNLACRTTCRTKLLETNDPKRYLAGPTSRKNAGSASLRPAHNPKVAGSNPAPATHSERPAKGAFPIERPGGPGVGRSVLDIIPFIATYTATTSGAPPSAEPASRGFQPLLASRACSGEVLRLRRGDQAALGGEQCDPHAYAESAWSSQRDRDRVIPLRRGS
jgi:hypothetical protein